jgi:succinyl-diaminopimelate desuccinylase
MKSLLEITKQLIATASTSDNSAALHETLNILAKQLSTHPAITIERFESNNKPSLLAYVGKERPAKFRVLLNGHVDVVPGKPEQFIPAIKDGRLYGRGALDMKAAAAVLTQVFIETANKLPYSLGLQLVTDEENGGENGTAYQLSQGVDTQLAIAGESTPLGAICNESRGFCWAEIDFKGAAAHSAYPWDGTNAILLAQEFTQKLLAAIPTPQRDEWCTTANIATISTPNVTFNRVPDQARMGIDIRSIASDKRFVSRESATDFLQQLAPKGSTVQIQKLEPSHFADPESSDARALARAVSEAAGKPAQFIRKHGAADIRFFSQCGIPALSVGLQGEGQHGDKEYVEIASIERYIATLTQFLANLDT